jgi:hypothetical protein
MISAKPTPELKIGMVVIAIEAMTNKALRKRRRWPPPLTV